MEKEDEWLRTPLCRTRTSGNLPRCVQQGRAKLFLHLGSVRTAVYSSAAVNCEKGGRRPPRNPRKIQFTETEKPLLCCRVLVLCNLPFLVLFELFLKALSLLSMEGHRTELPISTAPL